MYTTALNSVSPIQLKPQTAPMNEQGLENTVGMALLGDLNEQLSNISTEMKNQLDAKQGLRDLVSFLQTLNARAPQGGTFGGNTIEISGEEKQKLENAGLTTLNLMPNGHGTGYFMEKPVLQTKIDQTQDRISQMNATNELTMIQIQSLVDQRKNSLALLSNLMASKNESLMGIIRNLKN